MKKNFVFWGLGLAAVMVFILMGKQAEAVSYGKSTSYLRGLSTTDLGYNGGTGAGYTNLWASPNGNHRYVESNWYLATNTYFQNYGSYTLYYQKGFLRSNNYPNITIHAGGGGGKGGYYPYASPYIALSPTSIGTFTTLNLAIENSSTLHWYNASKVSMPSGTVTVNSGQLFVTNYLLRQTGTYTINVNSGGTWAMNSMVAKGDHNTDDALAGFGGSLYIKGDGLVVVSKDDDVSSGQIEMKGSDGGGKVYIQMGGGGTIRIDSTGRLRNGGWNTNDAAADWSGNYANFDNNGEFLFWDDNNHVYAGAISGGGRFYVGLGSNQHFIIGRNNGSATFSGTIEGAVEVTKEGSGTQVFSGNNSYTNGTTINGGVLQIEGNGTVGTGNVTNNASLYTSRSSIAAIFSDGGTSHTITGGLINYTGGGTLTIDSTAAAQLVNTSALGVRNTSGTVNVNANLTLADTLQAVYGTLNVNSGATVQARAMRTGDYSGYTTSVINLNAGSTVNLSSSLNAVSNGAGLIVGHWHATDYDHYGELNINGGTLTMLNDNIEIGWDGGGVMNVRDGTVNVKGVFLTDHNTSVRYRQFNLLGGTVNIGENGLRYVDSPGAPSYPTYDKSNQKTVSANDASGQSFIKLGAGTIGTLASWSSIANMELTDTATGVTFNTTNGYSITLSGVLSGSGKLVKKGNDILYLDGANTYSGGTRIEGGIVGVSQGTGFGKSSGTIVLNNGTIFNHGTSNPVIANNVNLEGTGSVRVGWAGSGFESSITLNGKISGAGQLQVANDGKNWLILGNSGNDWTGGLQVGGGLNYHGEGTGAAYARLGANNALGSGVLSFGGVGSDNVFDMWGFSEDDIAGLSSASGVAAVLRDSQGSGTLTLNTTANYEYFGTVAGGISLVKAGEWNSVQYLRSSNADWTGTAIVKSGALAVEKNDGFGTALITLDGGSIHNRDADITISNQIELSEVGGGIRGYGSGHVFTVAGYITDGVSNAGALAIDADSGLVVISGTANDYTGGTKIGEKITTSNGMGYLRLINNGYHLGSGAVYFQQANTTLDIYGCEEYGIAGLSSEFSGSIVKNESTTASSLTLNVASGDSYTFGGVIQDAITLVKTGEGTQILTGVNTYAGPTKVSGGVLQLDEQGQITTSDYEIAEGGHLIYNNSVDMTAGNLFLYGTGEVYKENENTLLLNGSQANAFAGNIYVHGGTLQVASSFADACGYVNGCTIEMLEGGVLKNITVQKGNVVVDGGTVSDTLTIEDTNSDDDPSVVKSGSVENAVITLGELNVEGGNVNTADVSEDGKLVVNDEGVVSTLEQTGGEASIEGGEVTVANLQGGETSVSGGEVVTANVSDDGDLTVKDNGLVSTLEQTGGEANVEGGTVAVANLSDGKTTVTGGEVQQANVNSYGDLTVADDGLVSELNQEGGLASVEGGEVTVANLTDGETTVSGGEVVTANLSDDGDLTVTENGVVSTLEQTGGEALVEGGEVTAANLSDGELTVAEDGEVGTLTQTGGDSYITGGEVELANLSDGNLTVSDYGAVTTLNQSGGESEISGGEVETANLSDGVLTVSEDGEISMLSQTGGDSYITGGKVEEAELSGNSLTLSDNGEMGTLTQTAGTANITGGKVKDSISLSGDDSVLNISGGKVNDVYQEAGTTNVTGGKVTGDFSLSGDNSVLNISDDGNVSTVYQESGTTNISGDSQVGSLLQEAGATNISGGTTDSIEIMDGTLTMTDGVVESLFQDDGAMTISGGEVTEFYQLGGTTEIKDDAVVYSGMLYGGETQMNGGTAGDMMLLMWDEATEGNLTVENAEILNLYQENGTATVKDSTLGTVSLLGGELTIEGGVVEETLAVTDGLSEWDETPLTGGNLTLLKDNEVPNLVVDAGNVVIGGSTIDVLDISGGRVTTDDLLDEILDNISIGDVSMDGGYLSLVELDEVGSLTLDRGATLAMLLNDEVEVASITADKIDLNGGSLEIQLREDQSFKAGDTYRLFSAASGITGDAVDDLSKLTQVVIKNADGSVKMKLDSGILPLVLQVTEDDTVLQFFVDPNIVPEPGTWMLLALGLLGLGVVSRRKRAKAA